MAGGIRGHLVLKAANRARRFAALALITALALPPQAGAVELKQKTVEAFDRYVQLSETRMDDESRSGTPFLSVDRLPEGRREAAHAQLRQGRIVIERLETLDGGKAIPVPNGLIHHWIGTVFIPGATLAQTLALLQDYDHHQDYYKPDVMRSMILQRSGDDFLVSLRFHKKKVLTSILDTEHEIHYFPIDATHAASRSRTTRIAEVQNAGESDEHLKPVGNDSGYLWRMNTYWRFEQKDGGTYVECQSISLTRDIPTGLGWLIGPYVESVPRESLTFTLGATRTTLLHRSTSASAH
jgi:hypothetical protein